MSKLNDLVGDNFNVLKLIALILTIVPVFFLIDGYIDSKIERKITDAEYIGKISKQLRPFMIFDETGVVQYDHGAESKIKSINVDLTKKIIEIETSEFLQLAPFIFSVGADNSSLKAERISNRRWKYTMLYFEIAVFSGGSEEKPKSNYVLEIIYP